MTPNREHFRDAFYAVYNCSVASQDNARRLYRGNIDMLALLHMQTYMKRLILCAANQSYALTVKATTNVHMLESLTFPRGRRN